MLYPLQFVWRFIDYDEHGPMEWEFRLSRKSTGRSALADIDPIPFARDGEWGAFFDGNDRSGNPPVVVVHYGDTSRSASYSDFVAWLAAAKSESGIGEPPYDRIEADPSYPVAADVSDGYFFCPNCYEANKPLHEYDTAILCESCGTFFNLK
ncbi:hypothetical protein [Yoonia sp. R78084]|uniref:hypothetical protein n=1 Tax=Yoonia sp. R78084 TaxID=3093869 RepID=UPI0037DD098E